MKNFLIVNFILIFLCSLLFKSLFIRFSDDVQKPNFLNFDSPWADSLIDRMSLEEKIGQLLIINANSYIGDKNYLDKVDSIITNFGVGGLIYFKSNPSKIIRLTNRFQRITKIPLINSIDAEWGLAMRIDSILDLPWNLTLGAIKDDSLIYEMGSLIAIFMKKLGFHLNFAPVTDVNSNPENPIISARSFGENPKNVFEKSLAYYKAMDDNNILSCAKHFPGHGDTYLDSHKDLPIIYKNKSIMDSIHIQPFKKLINKGIPSIMTGHLSIPSLDSNKNIPSSLSKIIIDSLLKKKLNYEGLVITDALNMRGIKDFSDNNSIYIDALLAGNDILLFPEDVSIALNSILRAVKDSLISEKIIHNSCHKILKAKEWLGLNNINDSYNLDSLSFFNKKIKLLNKKLEKAAITLIKNTNNSLPIKKLNNKKIGLISIGEGNKKPFHDQLKYYSNIELIDEKNPRINDFDRIILSIHKNNFKPWDIHELSAQEKKIVNKLSKKSHVDLVIFANPYCLVGESFFKNSKSITIAYQNSNSMQSNVAQSIYGAFDINGKLPITINSNFRVGKGINLRSIKRLKYTSPEEVDFPIDSLKKIDSIVNMSIRNKSIPGCQILIAKNSKVFFNKSYGYQTYDSVIKINNFSLYDIASITKISSTLPIIMNMVEEKKIDLNKSLKFYLSLDSKNPKSNIKINEILTHSAKLYPWIPFYISTIDDYGRLKKNIYSKNRKKNFNIEVADEIFLNDFYVDSIYLQIINSKMLVENKYKYSDLGFYLLKKIIENIYNEKIDKIIDPLFESLGANYITYNPLKKTESKNIVPTENDNYFRNQLLKGYVHDPGAAMQDGLGGHAGLFSNANDLAKLLQMYLNEGEYGDEKYFSKSTIRYFTSYQFPPKINRRGIGFDKPSLDDDGPSSNLASKLSYGHSGFTGTLVWNDPKYDLIYIFLSNRIHPNAENDLLIKNNVRTEIQDIIYNSIL